MEFLFFQKESKWCLIITMSKYKIDIQVYVWGRFGSEKIIESKVREKRNHTNQMDLNGFVQFRKINLLTI